MLDMDFGCISGRCLRRAVEAYSERVIKSDQSQYSVANAFYCLLRLNTETFSSLKQH